MLGEWSLPLAIAARLVAKGVGQVHFRLTQRAKECAFVDLLNSMSRVAWGFIARLFKGHEEMHFATR